MQKIPISRFKARCLAILEEVRRTKQPVQVTRFGVPVAEVGPLTAPLRPDHWMGSLKDTARIKGDIVKPAAGEAAWEVVRS